MIPIYSNTAGDVFTFQGHVIAPASSYGVLKQYTQSGKPVSSYISATRFGELLFTGSAANGASASYPVSPGTNIYVSAEFEPSGCTRIAETSLLVGGYKSFTYSSHGYVSGNVFSASGKVIDTFTGSSFEVVSNTKLEDNVVSVWAHAVGAGTHSVGTTISPSYMSSYAIAHAPSAWGGSVAIGLNIPPSQYGHSSDKASATVSIYPGYYSGTALVAYPYAERPYVLFLPSSATAPTNVVYKLALTGKNQVAIGLTAKGYYPWIGY